MSWGHPQAEMNLIFLCFSFVSYERLASLKTKIRLLPTFQVKCFFSISAAILATNSLGLLARLAILGRTKLLVAVGPKPVVHCTCNLEGCWHKIYPVWYGCSFSSLDGMLVPHSLPCPVIWLNLFTYQFLMLPICFSRNTL